MRVTVYVSLSEKMLDSVMKKAYSRRELILLLALLILANRAAVRYFFVFFLTSRPIIVKLFYVYWDVLIK